MRKLRALEDVLIRVESMLAVVLVLTMLLLAAYNVVYRNVLVPMQQHWAHSGPPLERPGAGPAPETKAGSADAKASPAGKPEPAAGAEGFGGFGGGLDDEEPADPAKPEEAKAAADDFGGFGGDLDEEPEPEPAPAKAEPETKAASDDFGGFGGEAKAEPETKAASDDFGGFSGEAKGEPEAKTASDDFGGFSGEAKGEPEAKAGGDDFGGFSGEAKGEPEAKAGGDDFGGFGGEAKTPGADAKEGDELDEADDLGDDDFGDGEDPFANLEEIDVAAKQDDTGVPQGGPPPAGSFAAWAVAFIDDIKLDWIDVFLRQLVIIVAFFGAMLATHRGKHINIDALSKVLPLQARRVVAVVLPLSAVTVCLMLASAGWDLVQISREYPKDVLPSVPEWMFQMMFPVGFGLLAAHFTLRTIEAVVEPPKLEPPKLAAKLEPKPEPKPAAKPAAEAAHDDEDEESSADQGGQV